MNHIDSQERYKFAGALTWITDIDEDNIKLKVRHYNEDN